MFFATKFWILTGFLAGLSAAIHVNIRKEQYEHVSGENIVLPCKFKARGNPGLIVISWAVMGTEDDTFESLILVYYHPMRRTDIKAQYEGRASLDFSAASGKANLKLSSVTPADSKIYECRVQIPGDDEGKTADTTRLDVYEAPSTPICKIQGQPEYGKNINLTCFSEKGSPPPLYTWQTRDVRNLPRVMDHTASQQGGILSLYNITRETSGYYRCSSANKVRSATCDITLTVLPPNLSHSLFLGSIAGVMAGAFASVVAVAGRAFPSSNANNGTGQTPTQPPSFV